MAVPTKMHQDILRACNLAPILREAIRVDAEIAFKGSICCYAEKMESQRRLTMSIKALLTLFAAFVKDNKENQVLMFEDLAFLQDLATPAEFKEEQDNPGLDERKAHKLQLVVTSTGAGEA